MKNLEAIEYWKEIAKYDLETAQAMLETKRFLYVGFMCHQAIEKMLKGYYLFRMGDSPPYSHNLTKIAKMATILEDFSNEQKSVLDVLEPLNIETRYPSYKKQLLKSLTKERCTEILDNTKRLFKWINQKLSKN